jgi:hypothetical protein
MKGGGDEQARVLSISRRWIPDCCLAQGESESVQKVSFRFLINFLNKNVSKELFSLKMLISEKPLGAR